MENTYLIHYGIKGMKWGVRRYQNEDGTRTEEGKKRYYSSEKESSNKGTAKKVAIAAGAALTLAGAAYLYYKNKDAVNYAVESALIRANENMSQDKVRAAKEKGKKAVVGFLKKNYPVAKEDFKKGVKKVAGAALEGAGVIAGTKIMKKVLGEERADDLIDAKNAYTKKDDKVKQERINQILAKSTKSSVKDYRKKR